MRSWPQVISFSLGIVPVAILAAIISVIAVRSVPAITEVGLGELFDERFSSQYGTGRNIFGLLPGIWGTITLTVLAIGIALPVSIAMALISTEFTLGYLGRAMRLFLGVLSGIPSIVYALAAVVFVNSLMVPKFAGDASNLVDFSPDKIGYSGTWPPADVPFNAGSLPWGTDPDPNSTLLGGILLALLVIPFLAPMIEDAIRGVPQAPKEASLALGTSRWHTFRRITLPYAAPGIISATALASLKAMGDVMIAIFVIGFEAPLLPDPLVDVVQRNPPLTAVGANLLGGIQGQGSCAVPTSGVVTVVTNASYRCHTAYFSAGLLIVFAFVIVAASFYLQNRFRRRYSR